MRYAHAVLTRRGVVWALLALAVLLALPVSAQEPPRAGGFGEEVDVEEVLLDVVVTDRRGDVVLGLGPEDFVVTEGKQRLQVQDVTFYSNRELLASPDVAAKLGIDPAEVPVDRYFILFFDDPRATIPRLTVQQLDAARWAKRWVETLSPNDHVAVVAYDQNLEVHQDFTTDAEKVVKGIERAVSGPDPTAEQAAGDPGGASLLARLPGAEIQATRIYDALAIVGRAAGDIPGRKNLVLFSIGFGEVNSLGIYEPDMRFYPGLTEVLNDNNVAVYGIDLIPTSAFGSLRSNVLGNSLSNLAADTGGRYFYNFVNFMTPLEQIVEDTSGYYLISYRSPRSDGRDAARFREVDVETVNPELRVRARRGYLPGR